jgi:hypothetical protein
MVEENDKEINAKKNWLTEHETIQDDLFDIKASLLKEMKTEEVAVEKANDTSAGSKGGMDADVDIPHAKPISEENESSGGGGQPFETHFAGEKPQTERANGASAEPTIKELLGVKPSKTQTAAVSKSPRREDTSSIPKHPELTNYIARVIEHESKIKRRIFEKEKQENRMAKEERRPKTDKKIFKKDRSDRREKGKGSDEDRVGDEAKPEQIPKTKRLTDDIDKILPEKLTIPEKGEEPEEIPATDNNIEWEPDEDKDKKKSSKREKQAESEIGKSQEEPDHGKEDETEVPSAKPKGFFRIKKFFSRR